MAFPKRIIGLFLLLLLPQLLAAQRVGLVLSGGGAKGLYHIGVIRALEENGIPIDYVSGTSMGAIIGGLYAVGYSPEEMTEIFTSDQVAGWMSGHIEDKYIYYFRQNPPSASMVNLLFGRDASKGAGAPRFHLPTNLISSRRIDLAFVEYFSAPEALCGGNFDKLFVPFRCVATDALARKEVTFRSGDLGKAVRASMTLPLVFRPLKQDSTLLYDGGIYNNFPWQVLEEDFSPDILIGSKCVAGNVRPEEDNIIDQITTLTTMHTDFTLPGEQDILLEHVFDDVTTLDFNKARYVIDRGYSDAIDAMPTIRERIARRTDAAELARRRAEFRMAEPAMNFERYQITGLNEHQKHYVERMLRLDASEDGRDEFTLDEFRSEYFKLLSTGDFASDYPEVTYNDSTGCFALKINLRTKPSFRVMVGGNISSTSMNQAYLGLEYKRIGVSAQSYRLDGYLSALYSSVQAGGRIDFFLKRPWAFDYSFNYNYYNYFRSDFGGLGKKDDLFYNKSGDMFLTTGLTFPTSRMTKLALRVNLGRDNFRYYDTPVYTDADKMDNDRFLFVGAQLDFDRNSLNHSIYATRGLRQSVSAIFVHGCEDYSPGTTSMTDRESKLRTWFGGRFVREQYFRIAGWFSAGYLVEGVLTNQPAFSNQAVVSPLVPAFTPTPHSHLVYLEDFRSRTFLGAGVMPTFEFLPRFYMKNSAYMFLPEDVSETKGSVRKRLRYIFSTSFVYQTPIGPASLTLSKYDATSNQNWFLTFNFGYTIFNKKGTFY